MLQGFWQQLVKSQVPFNFFTNFCFNARLTFLLYICTRIYVGKLLSVGDIVGNRLTDEQKEHLVQRIMKAVLRFDIPDIATLLPLLAIDSTVRNAVFKELKDFLRALNLAK